MPPRKKKNQNDIDRMAKLAAKLGMNFDQLMEEVPATEIGAEAVLRHSIEAESVLFYIQTRGKDFQAKNCKNPNCGLPFLHTYRAVDYCSEECRAWALAQHGIIWNFLRKSDSQRWNINNRGYVPKIIGAAATEALKNSGNLHTELPEEGVIEDLEEEIEVNNELPLQGIPEDSNSPVDEYEQRAEVQERFETMLFEERNS